jgi:ribonuclease D
MRQIPNIPPTQHNVYWVNTTATFNQMLDNLLEHQLVAVDTESDSLYSYFEKVCLIQFSIPQVDYLLDPLAIDVSGLAKLFSAAHIQKIFHAAEYDFLSLKRDYDFDFSNLFDTMLAARILGWPRYGLASILKDQFNVKLDKKFQRYNWGKRPLSRKALDYAHLDTHYLIGLRKIQLTELNQQNRLQEATESFERLTQVIPTPKTFDPDDFWRVKSARDLHPQQQAVLKELFIARDKIARQINRPPFKVMTDKVLAELAKTQPSTTEALGRTKGLSSTMLHHNANALLKAIHTGQSAPPPKYRANSNHRRPDTSTMMRYENLRQWRNDVAAERGVEPDVIISNHTLMDIARKNPKTLHKLNQLELLGSWQQETYGLKLLNVLKATSPEAKHRQQV